MSKKEKLDVFLESIEKSEPVEESSESSTIKSFMHDQGPEDAATAVMKTEDGSYVVVVKSPDELKSEVGGGFFLVKGELIPVGEAMKNSEAGKVYHSKLSELDKKF
jgi:hypothetical protein